jgi:hypothetical protein
MRQLYPGRMMLGDARYDDRRVSQSGRDEDLFIRRDAALKLVLAGEIGGWDALFLVVAPPPTLAKISGRRKQYGEGVKAEARRLHAAGMTGPDVARRLGVPFPTVKAWLWPAGSSGRESGGGRGRVLAASWLRRRC